MVLSLTAISLFTLRRCPASFQIFVQVSFWAGPKPFHLWKKQAHDYALRQSFCHFRKYANVEPMNNALHHYGKCVPRRSSPCHVVHNNFIYILSVFFFLYGKKISLQLTILFGFKVQGESMICAMFCGFALHFMGIWIWIYQRMKSQELLNLNRNRLNTNVNKN